VTYRLISATPSPYARKVRIALAEKAIPFELITEVPWDSTTATPRYNPLEKLPILLLGDDSSVYESSFILEFLEAKHPKPPLLPLDVDERLAARKFEVLCDGVCDAVVLTFFERRRPTCCQSKEWSARQRRKIEGGVREMARLVGDRQWAAGDRFSVGDIAVGTALTYLGVRLADFDWRALHPALAKYCDRMEQRPSFAGSRPVPQTIKDAVV
jgi:glutathione S-transferase